MYGCRRGACRRRSEHARRLQLDELVDVAREAGDTIAERLRALQASPDGRSDTVTASTSLPAFPAGGQDTTTGVELITDRIAAATATMRTVHDVSMRMTRPALICCTRSSMTWRSTPG
jgi:DNA-binding ferritin-like protein